MLCKMNIQTFNTRETSQQGNLELKNISTWNSSFQIFINTLDNILVSNYQYNLLQA